MTNEIKGHGGHASEDQPRCDGVMEFTSIQKAILSAIDLSKIDQALTGATDEERNAELERRVKELFSQIVVEFQGKGESRHEFGSRINRTVQGFLANTTLEIERLTKRVAELEEQLREADDKSREELSSQLDPLREHEAQLMKYVREYAKDALIEDREAFYDLVSAIKSDDDRLAAAKDFADRWNPERAEISAAYKAHARALLKLRDAARYGNFGLTSRDETIELIPEINVLDWLDEARERREAEAQALVNGGEVNVDQDVTDQDATDEFEGIFVDDPTLTESE